MKDKKGKINSPKDVPLIGQEEIKGIGDGYDIVKIRNKSSLVWKKIYFTVVIVAFVFFLIILFFRADHYEDDHCFGDNTDKVSDTIEITETTAIESENNIPVISPDVDTEVETSEVTTEDKPITPNDIYSFDYSLVPKGENAIIPIDLSMYSNGVTYINNHTGFLPDVDALLSKRLGGDEYVFWGASDAPKVLIVHTHATESYSKEGAISYPSDEDEIVRSDDMSETVVAVGKVVSEVLIKSGIPTLHCTVVHDSVQYKDSYKRSETTVEEYLKKYPSIKLVIDIHRDSVMTSNGDMLRPVTLIDSETVAQINCIVGSDWSGEKYENWQDNLSLALKLREELNGEYRNLCRPIELRETSYNQEASRYSLLIEIGSCGNSLDEAIRAGMIFAKSMAKIINNI